MAPGSRPDSLGSTPEQSAATLPRLRRLTRRPEFEAVRKSSLRSRDECFSVQALANALPQARLGVTVARRVSTKAVARNRIKRQIRESFRQHHMFLGGLNIVVTAQPPAGAKDNARLRASLDQHWEQLSRLCKKSRSDS